jgi:pre-mRNA-splicing helicase BRR2
MELSQMITQATWASDPLLKQVPHVTDQTIKRASTKEVESIFDLTDLEAEDRDAVLQLSASQLQDVALYCNRYPSVEMEHEVADSDDVHAGSSVTVNVSVSRDADDDDEPAPVGPVLAPFYPQRKDEAWWVVIGDPADNK